MQIVIIGAGHAGVQAAISLREMGYEERILLFSEESYLPYQKPALSKGFLTGKQSLESLWFRNEKFYQEQNIELRLGVKIKSLDIENKTITTNINDVFCFDKLIFATGSRVRTLSNSTATICYLQTLADAQNIQAKMASTDQVTVIGGGFIGLELAAAAIEMGKKVKIIETQSRLMARVLPPFLSEIFQQKHQAMGVEICLESSINDEQLNKTEGMIVAGIGVLPNQELAAEAGIACENGIKVDGFQQTSHEDIYAIGDCANHYNQYAQKWCRLESVQNATDQAKIAAAHIVKQPQPYNEVPWFWTHQYDLKLQMAGINTGYDQMVFRGDNTSQKFSIFYLKNNQLIGADSLNRPADHIAARKLIQAGSVTPTNAQIEDIGYKLGAI